MTGIGAHAACAPGPSKAMRRTVAGLLGGVLIGLAIVGLVVLVA